MQSLELCVVQSLFYWETVEPPNQQARPKLKFYERLHIYSSFMHFHLGNNFIRVFGFHKKI